MRRIYFLQFPAAIFLFLLLMLASAASATTYYVDSTNGSDSNDGMTSPWKTITHAAATVPAGTAVTPNQIILAAGTYDLANGETFPVSLANSYISLLGDTTSATRIQGDGSAVNLLEINATATGIAIQDITFANAARAIHSLAGGLTLTGNTFEATLPSGLYLFINTPIATPLAASATVAPIILNGNTFNCTATAVHIHVYLLFDDTIPGLAANLGGITASSNTFNINANQTGLNIATYAVDSLASGTVTTGSVAVTGNTFTGGAYGLNFYGYFDNLTDPAVTVGNVTVSSNTCSDQTSAGMAIDYYDLDYWYGSGTGTLGNLTIQNNTITSAAASASGIELIDAGYLFDLNGSVAVTTGPLAITGNTVSTVSDGIYVEFNEVSYFGDTLTDTAHATFGATTISNNTVTSSAGYGVYLYLYDIGYNDPALPDTQGQTWFNFGALTVSGNTISSGLAGLNFRFDFIGYGLINNAQMTMAPATASNNTVSAGGDCIVIEYSDFVVGSFTDNNAVVTLPDWSVTGNTLDSTGSSGVLFYTLGNPYQTRGNAVAHFGTLLIDNNTFNLDRSAGADKGVDLFIDDFCQGCYDSSRATVGDITVSNNRIYNTTNDGINVWYGEIAFDFDASGQVTMGKSVFSGNTIDGAPYGIYLEFDDAWSGFASTVTVDNMDFLDNAISNVTQMGIYFDLDASNGNPTAATLAINRPLIRGNTVSGHPGGAQSGIYLFGDIGNGVTFGTPEITNNTISGFSSGIYLDEGTLHNGLAGAQIRGNTVQNNNKGLQVNAAGSGYAAECNTFAGNSAWGLAVNTGFAATVKAEYNWWGDGAGPTACAACNGVDAGDLGSVDFTPWLAITPDKASRCQGGFPWPMFLPAITHPRP